MKCESANEKPVPALQTTHRQDRLQEIYNKSFLKQASSLEDPIIIPPPPYTPTIKIKNTHEINLQLILALAGEPKLIT